jgi:hypothetical protein
VDATRVDQIVQLALARAAQEDEQQLRELGPIHLLKYVYLADLAYAQAHGGETYTGIPWVFHQYGPWSPVAFERLDQAVLAIGADVRTFSSPKYDKDFTRYALSPGDADAVEAKLDRQLPHEVSGAVKRAVRTFGNDTGGLLDWVYRTPPMRVAAPGDRLDFSAAAQAQQPVDQAAPSPELTRRQEKKLEGALTSAQQAFRERLAARKAALPSPPKSAPPRYDEIFAEGSARLDAEGEVGPLKGVVSFPEDIWKSDWRDPDGGE